MIGLFGCFVVNPNEASVILQCGILSRVEKEAGLHCFAPCGREIIKVSTKRDTVNFEHEKIIDSNGVPVIISVVIIYEIINPADSCLNVLSYRDYITNQARAVVKMCVSKFP